MRIFSAVYLAVVLAATVSVMFLSAKWATSVPEVSCFVLAAVWGIGFIISSIRGGSLKPVFSVALAPLAGVVLWALLQLLLGTTVYAWPTRMAALYWAGNLAAFFCALQAFDDADVRDRFLRYLVFFGAVVAAFSCVQAFLSLGKIYWKFIPDYPQDVIFGPFVYRNQFAAFIEIILPLALYYGITSRTKKLLYLVPAAVLYGAVIASASRAGFILATVELGAVPLLAARRHRFSKSQKINGALALVAMLVWMAVPVGPGTLIDRLEKADPFQARREFNESTVRMVRDRPLIGFGLGTWSTVYPGYATFDDGKFANQAHDDWAQWAAEGGIPLFLLMLGLAVWAAGRGLQTGWGIGLPVIFLHCVVDYPIQRPGVSILFFIVMAAAAGVSRREGRQPESA